MEDLRSLEDLLDLQELDTRIDRLLEKRAGLPALAEYRDAHEQVGALEGELEEQRARHRELSLAEDKAEGEMEIDEAKLVREEARLYAGNLSARDATHLRDEVTMLRERVGKREEEALALLEQQQAAAEEIEGLENRLEAARRSEKEIESVIGKEWAGIDSEIAGLEAKKEKVVPLIAPELVELYEEIRPSKEGVAVAGFVDRNCGGCHLTLSAAEEAQILRADPPRCIHCRRILVPG